MQIIEQHLVCLPSENWPNVRTLLVLVENRIWFINIGSHWEEISQEQATKYITDTPNKF